jgi:hypothetical protein
MQTTHILRTLCLSTQDFVITICEIAVTAWRADDCSPVHIILDRDAFVEPIARIAVTKANQQNISLDMWRFKICR